MEMSNISYRSIFLDCGELNWRNILTIAWLLWALSTFIYVWTVQNDVTGVRIGVTLVFAVIIIIIFNVWRAIR